MVTKKIIQNNRTSNTLITLGIVWIVVAYILLLANHTQEGFVLFTTLGIGSLITSLGVCIKQGNGYKWLPIFVIGGVLVTLLAYLIYAFLYFVIVNN